MLSPQRAMGQYSTPQETVDYMVNSVLKHLDSHRPTRILDPSTGDGIFIRTLIRSGVSASQLHAFDIDPSAPSPYEGVHFSHEDFLKVEGEEKYEAIIGNPPYKSKRQSTYFTENKTFLAEQFKDIGVHNMYSLFIYKGLQLLKENGILSMIVQDSFLTNVYYKHFRNYLLKNAEIKEIILAPRRLFHHGKADVRTSILTLQKKKTHKEENHVVRLVDRLTYQQYENPPRERVQYLSQQIFEELPNYNFAVNVPNEILELFQSNYKPLERVVPIKTGISTGNDKKFLKKEDEIKSKDEWIPFYKNGGSKDEWYYPPRYYLHQDWPIHNRENDNFTLRNSSYFYKEGITCSSMGVKFSASYLPEGSLFGVNANLFPEEQSDLFYLLGLLNSTLVKYILRKVLNRTNMVTSGYIKKIPYISPSKEKKQIVCQNVKKLVEGKRLDPAYSTQPLHEEIDNIIFDVYGISKEQRAHIKEFCDNMLEQL